MAEPFENPGKIDISLGLAGQEEIRQLIAAVGTLSESVQAARSFSAGMQNQAEQRMYQSFQREGAVPFESSVPADVQQRLSDAAGLAASTPQLAPDDTVVMGPSEGASQAGPTIDDDLSRETSRKRLGRFRNALTAPVRVPVDKALEALIPNQYAPRQMDVGGDPGDIDELRDIGQAPGGSSGGASRPPDVNPSDPAWFRTIQEPGVAAPITMPRFGEFTAQDALRMAARPFQLFASSRYGDAREQALQADPNADLSEIQAGGFTGRVAAALGRGAAVSPYIAHFGQTYLGMGGGSPGLFGAQFSPNYLARQGERMGYNLPGTLSDVPVVGGLADDLGVNFNLPSSVRLGMDLLKRGDSSVIGREFRRMREGMRYAGISNEERMTVQERLIDAGRLGAGGTEGDLSIGRSAFRILSSEGRMGAANPEQIMDALLQATQHGTTNLDAFTQQLQDVPTAADAARVGIDEMTQQMTEMGNFFQNEMGGFFAQGTRFAQDFARSTGLSPVVGQAALQNPMVQGMISMNTGTLPQTFGALPSGALTGGVLDTMELMMNVFRGSNQGGRVDIPGVGRMRTSGRQADMALAAQQMGMSLDVFQGLWNRRREARALTSLDMASDTFRDSFQRLGGSAAGRRALLHSRDPNDQIASAPEIGDLMRRANIGVEQRRDVQRLLRTDPNAAGRKINKIISEKSEKLRERMENKSKTKVDVDIAFSGAAAKWLREVGRKVDDQEANSRDSRAGRVNPNRRHRDPDAPSRKGHNFINDMLNPQSIFPGAPEFDFDQASQDIEEGMTNLDRDVGNKVRGAADDAVDFVGDLF